MPLLLENIFTALENRVASEMTVLGKKHLPSHKSFKDMYFLIIVYCFHTCSPVTVKVYMYQVSDCIYRH